MGIILEERLSDSPFVERVWRSHSENITEFISVAVYQWELVVWTQNGKTEVCVQGPETQASRAPVPDNADFFGIVFKPGVYMPHLPVSALVNNAAMLPDAANHSFWLNSGVWQIPNYENADTFVHQLVRNDILTCETAVGAMLRGESPYLSLRSIQRRFLHTTGLTYRTMQQIERARRAALLLRQGVSILDTVDTTGYFDQAHLTKSLKYFIGQTPTQLIDSKKSEQLSLLYKTASFG